HAYTADYRPLFDDQEGRLAMLAARHIGIPIEVHSCASYLPFAGWASSPPPLPEPYHEPFRALYVDLQARIASHTSVTFSGYGGDGIMTGQAWPYLVYLFRGARFATLSGSFGGYILKHGHMPPLRGGFRTMLRRWTFGADVMADYPKWLAPQFESDLDLR